MVDQMQVYRNAMSFQDIDATDDEGGFDRYASLRAEVDEAFGVDGLPADMLEDLREMVVY